MKTSVKSVLAACVVASASPAAADLVATGASRGVSRRKLPAGSRGPHVSERLDGKRNTLTWYENGFNSTDRNYRANGDLAVNLAESNRRQREVRDGEPDDQHPAVSGIPGQLLGRELQR